MYMSSIVGSQGRVVGLTRHPDRISVASAKLKMLSPQVVLAVGSGESPGQYACSDVRSRVLLLRFDWIQTVYGAGFGLPAAQAGGVITTGDREKQSGVKGIIRFVTVCSFQ